jgi:hypothetical protein
VQGSGTSGMIRLSRAVKELTVGNPNRPKRIQNGRVTVLTVLSAIAAITFVQPVAAFAPDDLTIIELHHRTAEELLPVLRPLAASASISGIDYKLLVRGGQADVERLRAAVAALDRAQRQLRVSVRYVSTPGSSDAQFGVGQNQARASSTTSTATDTSVSSIQIAEGSSAQIAQGQSVPYISGVLATRGRIDGATIGYRELTSGFSVTPRINGDRVYVEIATQQQRPEAGAASSIQSASTTLSGPIGTWIEIGGVTSSSVERSTRLGAGAAARTSTQEDRRIMQIKVEPFD